MKDYLHALSNILKNQGYIFVQIVAAFLLPIKPMVILVGMMIVLDTVTGIWKARKTKDPFSSKKLSRIVSKMALYQFSLITFFILESYMLGEFVSLFTAIPYFLSKVIAIFFCTIELISINENIKAAYGLNFLNSFKTILHRAIDIKKDVKKLGKDEDDYCG